MLNSILDLIFFWSEVPKKMYVYYHFGWFYLYNTQGKYYLYKIKLLKFLQKCISRFHYGNPTTHEARIYSIYKAFHEKENFKNLKQLVPKKIAFSKRANPITLKGHTINIVFFSTQHKKIRDKSIVFSCIHTAGQKIFKKSRPKKLVKSNKSISQNFFLAKFHFLQFQKCPKAENQLFNSEKV